MSDLILIVDDDPIQRRLLQAALARGGYEILCVDGGEAALAAFEGPRGGDVSLVVLDLVMPDIGGLNVLETMRERGIAVPVVVQTSQGGIDTVVAAMRAGAFDFVVKPVSPDKLNAVVAGALKVQAKGGVAGRGAPVQAGSLTISDLQSRSPSMERVIRLAQKAAASNIPILIEGESGVGKEVVARAIQGASGRRSKPFVTVNCGAIPDNLVESILFGHEKGAFTGATEKHTGKFVEADRGTLFLDEIGDLPLDVQVKLLRAVQDGEVDAVGGRKSAKVDIRLISATHRNLLQRVKDGAFREDLFYRLNVFPVFVPPLRERREDIADLVALFIERMGKAETGGRVSGIAGEAMALLKAYDWPGNIRQLENAVFRAVVLCEGSTLTSEEFPQIRAQVGAVDTAEEPDLTLADRRHDAPRVVASAPPLAQEDIDDLPREDCIDALDAKGHVRSLAEVELEMVQYAIRRYRGQMSEVARRLGIGRSTLYRKLKEHGIDPDSGREFGLVQ
ncbi:sigma-54-dependent transcriptional regulator [Mesorhizobium xinjiangense]|uniref:sigma-54-dependent transcriptional regulator n=1 Tax=Mesorhizobium xinjiangense TaxID=2678685 RepID=UPI0012ED8DE9|nr:sigma-54 dependent transcriptional regulator [Mesorhizobium xinjiangense]